MAISPLQQFVAAATAVRLSNSTVASSVNISVVPSQSASSSSSSAVLPSVSNASLASSALREAATNFSQLSSLTETAQSGTDQISKILQQLQSLTQQIPATDTADLSTAFQQAFSAIDQIISNTQFSGKTLLDGSSSTGSSDSSSPNLPDLSSQTLFSGQSAATLSADDANTAATLANAQSTVDNTNALLTETKTQISLAAAGANTAIANNLASTSVLTQSDIAGVAIASLATGLLSKPTTSAQVQTSKLSDNILSLLNE